MRQAWGRLGKVASNPGFASLLLIFSLLSVSSMAFIAASSYIYINGFSLSEQTYSYYFAFNALGMITGPVLYLRLARRFLRRSIIRTCFAVISASGLLIALLGSIRPLIFAMVLLPATIMASCVRTPGANLMLEQQEEDTGSASALMSCFGILMGSVGMTYHLPTLEQYHPGPGRDEHPNRLDLSCLVAGAFPEAVYKADS